MARLMLRVGDSSLTFELLADAPETVRWLTDATPTELRLVHGQWSGQACAGSLAAGAAAPLESPISSIYPGYLLVVPDGGFETGVPGPAVLVGYGAAELRDEHGRAYGSPVARLVGPLAELQRCLAPLRESGQVTATVSIAE